MAEQPEERELHVVTECVVKGNKQVPKEQICRWMPGCDRFCECQHITASRGGRSNAIVVLTVVIQACSFFTFSKFRSTTFIVLNLPIVEFLESLESLGLFTKNCIGHRLKLALWQIILLLEITKPIKSAKTTKICQDIQLRERFARITSTSLFRRSVNLVRRCNKEDVGELSSPTNRETEKPNTDNGIPGFTRQPELLHREEKKRKKRKKKMEKRKKKGNFVIDWREDLICLLEGGDGDDKICRGHNHKYSHDVDPGCSIVRAVSLFDITELLII
ncbi:hypothetical protein WN51_05492 [Melipona quadrifasciata]|uniref:Uncharacterized protein n=1 Tax=Melipona quadrifasciata TaxID=166423 RepID=A0A0M9AAN3_9HYME|nr:hypothetical protein WN51_05492 [Melipona quadrifasciata]